MHFFSRVEPNSFLYFILNCFLFIRRKNWSAFRPFYWTECRSKRSIRYPSGVQKMPRFQMSYDAFMGRPGHMSMSDVFAHLISVEDNFSFMPDQGPEVTAKIVDWFLLNARGDPCSLEDMRPGYPMYLHGNIISWDEQVSSLSVGNVRIDEWWAFSNNSKMFLGESVKLFFKLKLNEINKWNCK